MVQIAIDVREFYAFATDAVEAAMVLDNEMRASTLVALHEGIGYAQEHVPRGNGDLAASIRILEGPDEDGGAYGTDMIYAWQREEGGTIYARNGKALVFTMPEAVSADNPEGLVFAKSVTQEGSHYMQQSMDDLEPRLEPIYQLAVDRALEVLK